MQKCFDIENHAEGENIITGNTIKNTALILKILISNNAIAPRIKFILKWFFSQYIYIDLEQSFAHICLLRILGARGRVYRPVRYQGEAKAVYLQASVPIALNRRKLFQMPATMQVLCWGPNYAALIIMNAEIFNFFLGEMMLQI